MSKLVRGDRLPSDLRREVLARYVYRWTSDNPDRERMWRGREGAPTIPLVSDAQWLRDHAFYVTARGTLDRRRASAEPAYMAEDEGAGSRHATRKGARAKSARAVFRRRGAPVEILPSPMYRAARGRGIIHKTRKRGVLMEDARIGPEAGWDVYDVVLDDGEMTSAYGFDLRPIE
jgi:hypothetical protein